MQKFLCWLISIPCYISTKVPQATWNIHKCQPIVILVSLYHLIPVTCCKWSSAGWGTSAAAEMQHFFLQGCYFTPARMTFWKDYVKDKHCTLAGPCRGVTPGTQLTELREAEPRASAEPSPLIRRLVMLIQKGKTLRLTLLHRHSKTELQTEGAASSRDM